MHQKTTAPFRKAQPQGSPVGDPPQIIQTQASYILTQQVVAGLLEQLCSILVKHR
ncbi:MAG: hypothetical protein BWY82_02038 [Verrucomicrobia bacterium ADurb.Bin474]|nr:MAG: hypothetical protein BWY82_02038 [Verrucomicrobia bacterium ADurb.Bin474]